MKSKFLAILVLSSLSPSCASQNDDFKDHKSTISDRKVIRTAPHPPPLDRGDEVDVIEIIEKVNKSRINPLRLGFTWSERNRFVFYAYRKPYFDLPPRPDHEEDFYENVEEFASKLVTWREYAQRPVNRHGNGILMQFIAQLPDYILK